jgi:PSP1 C-terminal conserved region
MGVFHADILGLKVNDFVIVTGDRGFDLGMVFKLNVTELEARALMATLCREEAAAEAANENELGPDVLDTILAACLQIKERDVTIPENYVCRLATPFEVATLRSRMLDEMEAKQVCEMAIRRRRLEMSVVDVEYQWYVFKR